LFQGAIRPCTQHDWYDVMMNRILYEITVNGVRAQDWLRKKRNSDSVREENRACGSESNQFLSVRLVRSSKLLRKQRHVKTPNCE
jgi:hypothetical protein